MRHSKLAEAIAFFDPERRLAIETLEAFQETPELDFYRRYLDDIAWARHLVGFRGETL